MENEKKFEIPTATVVKFDDTDIIVTSGPGDPWQKPGDEWQD